ncbi:hypothetical protein BDK92_7347 [Micromonospora pisi]|uniref:Uncharacterized protein n=1 Tax=Micromonospora pisi TaxID=589240 RepID=A0A495JWD8_9ACTN|nr:hypothetical protein [Micromonospora pisi]RKR92865.1 hypothetical protein BDK92_7347 [Micromonospora pisi]
MTLTQADIQAVAPGQLVMPKVGLLIVTPAHADKWLADHNDWNRKFKPGRIETYERDMNAGHWLFNDSSIGFFYMPEDDGTPAWSTLDRLSLDELLPNEVLGNGQHRLTAIKQTGRPALYTIIRGIIPKAKKTIDRGAKRSIADSRDEANANTLVAIATRVLRVQRGLFRAGGANAITDSEINEYIDANPSLGRAVDVASLAMNRKVPIVPAVIGAAYHLCSQLDGGTATAYAEVFFVDQLIKNINLSEFDPAQVLYQRLRAGQAGKRNMPGDDAWPYVISAWNHFRKGSKPTKLQAPPGGWTPQNIPTPK